MVQVNTFHNFHNNFRAALYSCICQGSVSHNSSCHGSLHCFRSGCFCLMKGDIDCFCSIFAILTNTDIKQLNYEQMKMNLFNFQGGTIKLMVKSLGIDLEEDKGDVIGLDVQDKVKMSSFNIN